MPNLFAPWTLSIFLVAKQLQVIRITFCEKGQLQKKGRGFPSKDIMENALKIGFGNGKEHFVWECHGDVFVDFFCLVLKCC